MEALSTVENAELTCGFYAILGDVRTEKGFIACVQQLIEELGFDEYSFIGLDLHPTPQHELFNFSKELLESYRSEGLFKNDPVVQHAKNVQKPFFSSFIQDELNRISVNCDITKGASNIFSLNKRFGYHDFLHVPVNGQYLLSVTKKGASPLAFKRQFLSCKSTLTLLSEAIFYVTSKRFPSLLPEMQEKVSINPKPLHVLELLANSDLTIGEVADQLCISRITANHHLKEVRRKLSVRTNNAAIKKAMQLGLIQYSE